MNEITYGALKRIVEEAKEYRKITNAEFPVVLGNDIDLVEDWIDEVAKEY